MMRDAVQLGALAGACGLVIWLAAMVGEWAAASGWWF